MDSGPFVSICLQKSLLHRAAVLPLSAEPRNTGLEHAQAFASTEADMQWIVTMSTDLCAQGRWPQEASIYPFKGGIWNEPVLAHSPFQNRLQPLP